MLSRLAAEAIRDQRVRKGLSQSELARRAQVSRTVLSRLEAGTTAAIQTDTLDRLFEALDFKPGALGEAVQPDVRQRLARFEQQRRREELRGKHLRLAVALAADERSAAALVRKARDRVDLWRQKRSCSPYYIKRWSKVLSLPPRRVASAMASFGEWEDAMFQNSPWSWAWI